MTFTVFLRSLGKTALYLFQTFPFEDEQFMRYPGEQYDVSGARIFREADSGDAWIGLHARVLKSIDDPGIRAKVFLLLIRLFSDKTQVQWHLSLSSHENTDDKDGFKQFIDLSRVL